MKKNVFIITAFIIVGIILGILYAAPHSTSQSSTPSTVRSNQSTPNKTLPYLSQKTPGIPHTITIPAINVSTIPVEQVGKDNQGRMAVPVNWYHTGWYEYGPKPGEIGNAVIDGHLDTPSGTPSVFWNLKNLKPGDSINVTDTKGNTFIFKVAEVTLYPLNSFPIEQVFGPSSSAHLNLITCGGTWNEAAHIYNQRVVVYANLQG